MNDDLTPRQQQVLSFIRSYSHANGYPPSIRDIGEALKITSPNGVTCHFKALAKKGYITINPNKTGKRGRARTVRVIGESRDELLDIIRKLLPFAQDRASYDDPILARAEAVLS